MLSKKKFARPVSIIGVGCSPFGDGLNDPRLKDRTWHDLWTMAVMEACEDAHVNPQQIDAFCIANSFGETMNNQTNIYGPGAYWAGLNQKAAFQFAAACSGTNIGVMIGGSMVASSKRG